MRSIPRIGALAALVMMIVSAAAWGQALPKPAEFYFDEDRLAVQPLVVEQGSDEAAVKRLRQLAERGGRNADKAHAQLAGLLMASGRVDNGKALYAQLLQRLPETHALRRAVRYRYGWDLYRAGEPQAALEQWQPLVAAGGTTPAWAPPTLALVLWKLDRRDEARQWYAAAVRSEPTLWSSTTRYATLLPDWREDERATLAEVQAAWAADPPQWP
jgi:tetratricopeptide (TPR) repeat protein